MAPSEVEVEPTVPINETAYAKNEEFFLFTTIMDATMIDKKLGDKPVYFEVSIGNAGNALDGHNESKKVLLFIFLCVLLLYYFRTALFQSITMVHNRNILLNRITALG